MLIEELAGLQKLVLPDHWQSEAIQALKNGQDIIVDAPTGAGKTYVFEQFIVNTNFSRTAFYTVPTRALANDKFAEWKQAGWPVGIMTGDVVLDPSAPVVVATLEAIQSRVLQGRPPQLLVVDEYQWLNDPLRGNHYEGVILSLPPTVQLLLLSGSVSNPEDVCLWLERLGRDPVVIQHRVRPVPIEEMDADELARAAPRSIQGFWSRRVAGALREDLGPILLFAPRRQDAERLARQLARELPLARPLQLTTEQERLLGTSLIRQVRQRVTCHHSGLSYAQRAGIIEPLAKAGQLRAVVATLGLSAGINFSLRSVLITGNRYRFDGQDHEIQPHELLQMIGRAGRRGLDKTGYFLCHRNSPRLTQARPRRLKRSDPLPWAFLLRRIREGDDTREAALAFGSRLFTSSNLPLGVEQSAGRTADDFPCHILSDTGRARLVRRTRRPCRACMTCALRRECLDLSPEPTLLWQWTRIGLLDRQLHLTERGRIVSFFSGPEGLALAAAMEDRKYPVEELLFDTANLFAGDRFAATNPRSIGRLALSCHKAYRRFTIAGYLTGGLPPQYGSGAAEVVTAIIRDRTSPSRLVLETVGKGDIDRLLTEWRSLLRQIVHSPFIEEHPRWEALRSLAAAHLENTRHGFMPCLPPLTPAQRCVS